MYDPERCKKCKYSAKLSSKMSDTSYSYCCIYILIEGKMRGCYEGRKCKKFAKRKGKRRIRVTHDGGILLYGRYEE